MPLTRPALAAAAAAAALAAAPAAQAAASAEAFISTLSITLYDLDPLDDIAPAISFLGEYSQSYAWANNANDSTFAALFYQPTGASVANGTASGSAGTGPGGAFGSASVLGDLGNGDANYGQGTALFGAQFEVTPWTGVVITTAFVGTATTTLGIVGPAAEYAQAVGSISLDILVDSGWEYHTAQRLVWANYQWDGNGYTGMTQSFQGNVRLSYANLSDAMVHGQFAARAEAYAQSMVPVPEPGTYALLLAGLAGVGAVVRRRRG